MNDLRNEKRVPKPLKIIPLQKPEAHGVEPRYTSAFPEGKRFYFLCDPRALKFRYLAPYRTMSDSLEEAMEDRDRILPRSGTIYSYLRNAQGEFFDERFEKVRRCETFEK